jgi:divalent metal cation (Fe/Co/Zn/Cd) transporter
MVAASTADETEKKPRSAWVKRAQILAIFTIAYNLVEGVVSIGFGLEEMSWALLGFGMDSFVEVASAGLVLWRFQGSIGRAAPLELARERRATGAIGSLFVVLALATMGGATHQLMSGSHPETTWPGLIIAALSLSFMFILWRAKLAAADALDSKVMASDAACSLACIKLSSVLLVGSVVFVALPQLWWVDGAAAWVLALLIGSEGWEMIKASSQPDFQGGCGCGSSVCADD